MGDVFYMIVEGTVDVLDRFIDIETGSLGMQPCVFDRVLLLCCTGMCRVLLGARAW